MCIASTSKGQPCKNSPDKEYCHAHIHQSMDIVGAGGPVSMAETQWLDFSEKQYKLPIIRQHYIPGIGKVDGYIPKLRRVFEYHGSYWHGNPWKFPPNEVNKTTKNLYGSLFEKTLLRDIKILCAGYNLSVKWDTPFPNYRNILDYCIRNGQY